MEENRFDRLTRRLARTRLSRRAALASGGPGAAALGLAATGWAVPRRAAAAGAAQSTPQATDDPNAMSIDGAWFCNQTFGLCTTAPCEPDGTDSTIANCNCVVVTGYAIGYKTCEERAPSGLSLTSNFSTLNVNSAFSVLTCPENAPWANCLDMPCEIDPLNPAQATCQCEVVETGPSLTFGGGCDESTCTSIIWSAAPEGLLGLSQYETGMQRVNRAVALPVACPAASPVASPVGTPTSG